MTITNQPNMFDADNFDDLINETIANFEKHQAAFENPTQVIKSTPSVEPKVQPLQPVENLNQTQQVILTPTFKDLLAQVPEKNTYQYGKAHQTQNKPVTPQTTPLLSQAARDEFLGKKTPVDNQLVDIPHEKVMHETTNWSQNATEPLPTFQEPVTQPIQFIPPENTTSQPTTSQEATFYQPKAQAKSTQPQPKPEPNTNPAETNIWPKEPSLDDKIEYFIKHLTPKQAREILRKAFQED